MVSVWQRYCCQGGSAMDLVFTSCSMRGSLIAAKMRRNFSRNVYVSLDSLSTTLTDVQDKGPSLPSPYSKFLTRRRPCTNSTPASRILRMYDVCNSLQSMTSSRSGRLELANSRMLGYPRNGRTVTCSDSNRNILNALLSVSET